MEAVFTLPYPEFEVIDQIEKIFKKEEGYSVLVPTSRKQEGIDFAILSLKNRTSLKAQVKSSRSYLRNTTEKSSRKNMKPSYYYNLHYTNFIKKYTKGTADLYFFFGIYQAYLNKENIKANSIWKNIILVFTDEEINSLLNNVKTKKEGKVDRYIDFGFNDEENVFIIRGLPERKNVTKHLLKNRTTELLGMFNNYK